MGLSSYRKWRHKFLFVKGIRTREKNSIFHGMDQSSVVLVALTRQRVRAKQSVFFCVVAIDEVQAFDRSMPGSRSKDHSYVSSNDMYTSQRSFALPGQPSPTPPPPGGTHTCSPHMTQHPIIPQSKALTATAIIHRISLHTFPA